MTKLINTMQALLTLGLMLTPSSIVFSQQVTDSNFHPVVPNPAFETGAGPVVLVDEAHNNFHTLSPFTIPDEENGGETIIPGRLGAFRQLLLADGYLVEPSANEFTPQALANASIVVISNAVSDANIEVWRLPNPSAFNTNEIKAIVNWVRSGGALLLIADHQPWPAAAASLASELGVIFNNGYASVGESEIRPDKFSLADGSLMDHPIIRGRSESESIKSIATFGGQAFRPAPGSDIEGLMVFPRRSLMFLLDDPDEPWPDLDQIPQFRVDGMFQGAVLKLGVGRVAVFGEAAMFTAQITGVDRHPMGMNHPAAAENPQFVLNVFHWLSGLLADDEK